MGSTEDNSKIILEAMDDKFAFFLENVDSLIDRKLQPIAQDVRQMKGDVGTLKSDVGTLKSDVNTIKSDVGTLQSDVQEIKEIVEGMQEVMATQADIIDLTKQVSSNHKNLDERLIKLEKIAA